MVTTIRKIRQHLPSIMLTIALLGIWELLVHTKTLSRSVFPTPTDIIRAVPLTIAPIVEHLPQTLVEAGIGLGISVVLAFIIAMLMDRFYIIARAVSPHIIITQAVPIFAVAPMFVIWFGFGITPKVIVVVLICTFPIVIGLYEGLKSVSEDMLDYMRCINANYLQTFAHLKLPSAVPSLFSGLKIAGTYSITAAVIGEWLAGDGGLGTLMMRYKNAYRYSNMFVVIAAICLLSLMVYFTVSLLRKFIQRKVKW
jgi:ABC-type nitrate/sulfonate/bicarbonate transport system permease component